jgi:hypothetical protein
MSSRALILAAVLLVIRCFAADSASAQPTNLEAGKSPSQIFAGACSVCHKSPRGLLKTVGASSLPGFLRQHYTTSTDMASLLASYLVSNGATDTRYQSRQEQPKQGRERQQEAARPPGAPDQPDGLGRRRTRATEEPAPADAQQAERPEADGLNPQDDGQRASRHARRPSRAATAPDAGNSAQTAVDSKPDPRQKLSKRGKPTEEIKPGGAPGNEAAKVDSGKGESERAPQTAKPASESSSDAKVDGPKETGGSELTPSRPDLIPPATPAPPAAAAAPRTPEPAARASAPLPSSSAAAPVSPPPPAAPEPPASN